MNKPTIVLHKYGCLGGRDIHFTALFLHTKNHKRNLDLYTRIRDAKRGARRLQAALGGPRIISIVEE